MPWLVTNTYDVNYRPTKYSNMLTTYHNVLVNKDHHYNHYTRFLCLCNTWPVVDLTAYPASKLKHAFHQRKASDAKNIPLCVYRSCILVLIYWRSWRLLRILFSCCMRRHFSFSWLLLIIRENCCSYEMGSCCSELRTRFYHARVARRIYLLADAATWYAGELGIVRFNDLNEWVDMLRRQFVSELWRCKEIKRHAAEALCVWIEEQWHRCLRADCMHRLITSLCSFFESTKANWRKWIMESRLLNET